MSEIQAAVSSRTRISPMWIIPVVAVVAGIWMVAQSYLNEGPTVSIEFKTAAGLAANKTKIKMLSVDIGIVELVTLKPDMSGVLVTVQLDKEVKHLLREDTQFWVVRARIGAGGVTGLGTILSGAYIEMAPGSGKRSRKDYTGLETPPLTSVGAAGRRITLISERASIKVGDSILYRGFKVGRVEAMKFDEVRRQARYDVFIDAPYHELVHTATRFWDTSGISIQASAEGVRLHMGSLETVLSGGVAFGTPPDLPRGNPAEDNSEFRLYASYADILKNPYKHGAYFVVAFHQSLGGLLPGAPVEYLGIQIGRVERILLKEFATRELGAQGDPLPVLIYLEPGRMEVPDTADSVTKLQTGIRDAVASGLRATLKTGNLLTGKQLINFDYHPTDEPGEIGRFEQYVTLPTIETGVGRLEQQVSDFLAKLNALPLNDTVSGANKVLTSVDATLAKLTTTLESVNQVVASQGTQALPGELAATLAELRSVLDGFSQDAELYQSLNSSMESLSITLDNINQLSRELRDKPNSLLFPVKHEPDPMPETRP